MLGQKVMIGFEGTHPNDASIRTLSKQIEAGLVGGLILFKYNVESPSQVYELTRYFRSLSAPYPLLLGVDQEGGRVQRLNSTNGFRDFKSAKEIGDAGDVDAAYDHYAHMAQITREAGFNVVFGPVVDIHDAVCPVIGAYGRSYGQDAKIITPFARAFVEAHRSHGILTSLKHFPGHGSSLADSHGGFVDITKTWSTQELIPFQTLIEDNAAHMIMTAHVWSEAIDPHNPASLSKRWMQQLRRDLNYQGVVITDDLCMGAIMNHAALNDAVVASYAADSDIALLSMNALARLNAHTRFKGDTLSVEGLHAFVEERLDAGILAMDAIKTSCSRVISLKESLRGNP